MTTLLATLATYGACATIIGAQFIAHVTSAYAFLEIYNRIRVKEAI